MEQFLDRLPTERRVLPNGLTVLVREERSAPVVTVVTHVKAGYFDEPDPVVGISHVLEHMYFKGTERRGVGEIARETKAAGGYLNAGTIYDHTSYYTVLPSAALEQALDIQSDALLNSAIDEDELRRELQVIIQEAQRKLDNPEAVAQETLFATMFDVHRIRRWRIGTEPVLSRFTRADVLRYYRELYHPANTIVVIAGDVEAEHAFALAERYYGRAPAGEPVRDAGPIEPPVSGFRFRELEGDIMHTYLEWGWRTPGTMHEDTPALDVLALVLGQGRASRLYREVREAGLVNAVSAYNYTPTDVGVFGLSAELRPEQTEPAIRALHRVLQAVRAHGIEAHEVQRARNILEARMMRRLETAEGQARLLAEWEALGGWELAGDYMERLLSATAAQLHRVAEQYLNDEAGTLLLYRPASAPAAGPAQRIREQLRGDAASHVAPAPPRTFTNAYVPATLAPEREEDGVRFYRTAWGGNIAILPRAGAPLLTVAVAHRGGTLREDPHNAGLTGLMMRASVKGTTSRSAAQLAEESEALGMSIGPGSSADGFDWTITLPARHASHGLDLLADTVLRPRFADADVQRERDVALSDLEQLRDDMYQYPLRLVLDRGFGMHPYGYGLDVLMPALRAADAAAVRAWHARAAIGDAPWIFAAGDVRDADALAAEIGARFAREGTERTDETRGRVAGWAAAGAEVVEERQKAQTAIVLGFPGPDRNHADLHALRVLSNAISGLGGRLFEELRSRRSLAYAVAAYPVARWQGGAYVAYIGTAPEREEEARTELLKELLRCAEERLPEDELERSKRYTIGAWQIRRQTTSRQLADMADALMFGSGLGELRAFEDGIRAVTAETVRAAAERWLDPQRAIIGVVRGGSRH